MRQFLISLCLVIVAAVPASAGSVLFGASYGQTGGDIENLSDPLEIDDQGWEAYLGYMFLRVVGIEAGYVDLGEFDGSTDTLDLRAEAEAYPLWVVGTLPLNKWEIFAKAGAAFWEVDSAADDGMTVVRASDDGTDIAYGLGFNFYIVPGVLLHVQYEYFDIEVTDGVSFVSLGAQIRF